MRGRCSCHGCRMRGYKYVLHSTKSVSRRTSVHSQRLFAGFLGVTVRSSHFSFRAAAVVAPARARQQCGGPQRLLIAAEVISLQCHSTPADRQVGVADPRPGAPRRRNTCSAHDVVAGRRVPSSMPGRGCSPMIRRDGRASRSLIARMPLASEPKEGKYAITSGLRE